MLRFEDKGNGMFDMYLNEGKPSEKRKKEKLIGFYMYPYMSHRFHTHYFYITKKQYERYIERYKNLNENKEFKFMRKKGYSILLTRYEYGSLFTTSRFIEVKEWNNIVIQDKEKRWKIYGNQKGYILLIRYEDTKFYTGINLISSYREYKKIFILLHFKMQSYNLYDDHLLQIIFSFCI